jgi:hypothetical protein
MPRNLYCSCTASARYLSSNLMACKRNSILSLSVNHTIFIELLRTLYECLPTACYRSWVWLRNILSIKTRWSIYFKYQTHIHMSDLRNKSQFIPKGSFYGEKLPSLNISHASTLRPFPSNIGLCGLVVRVYGYRSRGPRFDFRPYQILWEVGGLLEWKSSGYDLENRD